MNKAEFFAVLPRPRVEAVEIEGASAPVHVRELTVRERIDFEAATDGKPNGEVLAALVALTACDASGARIFEASDVADIEALSPRVLVPLVTAASRINAMSPEDVEDLGNA